MEWYYLNPDYRRSAPKDQPFCCRCQKPVSGGIKVTVDHETKMVRKDDNGKELIGKDCWKQITKKENE